MPRPPVHPRGCGEHCEWRITVSPITGSSPRVRGTQSVNRVFLPFHRFIPAGAGNTPPSQPPRGCEPVHPRGCGEHSWSVIADPEKIGSSPRVRGTRDEVHPDMTIDRFIPAGAGNTKIEISGQDDGSVHPRGCGEHRFHRLLISSLSGSSPRVRGTLDEALSVETRERFIPAGAGNTP